MAEEKAKIGRPSIYTEEIATEICERIANGESSRSICKDEHMPFLSTMYRWLLKPEHKSFCEQYEIACNVRAEHMFDELLEIADDGTNDFVEKEFENGHMKIEPQPEAIGRSRLRVDTRKWYLSKVLPKKFGDKLDVTTDNQPINKISIEIVNGTQTQVNETDGEQLSV
jgi:hypothetical protein